MSYKGRNDTRKVISRCSRALTGVLLFIFSLSAVAASPTERQLAYVVSDLGIPYWEIMARGISSRAEKLGYKTTVYSTGNNAKQEFEVIAALINQKVDGILLSPSNSSAAVTLLKLAGNAGIPVVIADIGSDGGEYVSYIASDNQQGSYQIGRVLADAMRAKGWGDGSIGIIAIPQMRANGRERTAGFMKAMDEAGIKGAGLHQQVDFSYQETYAFATQLIKSNPNLRALWLQGSDRYQAALDAIAAAGRKDQIMLVSFDAEPEFLQMIPEGTLVGAAMQQPFLIGEKAVDALDSHLNGRTVVKEQTTPVLPVSRENISELLPAINRNVLGLGESQ